MRLGQQQAYDELFDSYAIPYDPEKPLPPSSGRRIIEIGFGMGDATYQIARDNPQWEYIAVDVHRAGVARLLCHIQKEGLTNLKVVEHDAVEFLQHMIPPESVEAFHIFFPDPWPKKRHHKRRLIQEGFAALLAEKINRGGYLYSVTDWGPYAEQILRVFEETRGLKNAYQGFAEPQNWRPKTKFEQKGIEKRHGIYEVFFKKG